KTTLGKYDISAIPHKKDNWHSFLNKLLELRCWPDTEVLCTAIGTQILDNFPLLKVSDFKDLSSLAVKLRDPQDPLSLYIRGHFFEATQQLLAEYNGSSLPSEQLNAALVDGLNRVLCDASLYSEERFKGITLVETTSGLINKKPKGDTLVYLNRLLLEQAYPHAVRNSLKMHDSGDNKAAVNIHAESASKIISLSKDTVTKIVEQLGEEVGYELVSHVYAFNSLIQNNITGKAYEDVSRYPHYLLDSLLPHKTGLDEMIGALEAFRYGCQLRAYGTYDYFEGGAGRFSRFKGGIQRVLLAMEYIPNTILKESIDWKGFVVSGWTEKFQTLNQVINVPSASVWSVRDWWAIYHETGHVLNNSIQGLVSSKVPAIDFWLNKNVPKSAREHWLSNLGELSAEVLGFELGFYGKFDLFMEKMWRYIGELEDIYGNLMQLYYYSFRTFFVWLFYSHFREGTISQEDFQDVDFCFKEYLSHIETIEKIIGRDFPDKPFKPREHAKLICSLYDFGDHLNRFINEFELTAMTSELDEPNTLAVFNSLQKGIVWPEPIKYPRAVLYKILEMENDEISFESKIACILSFWNGNITNYQ
ncbi:hypothetical protein KA005_11805, partial [bacterium]|nr:hypothetical protein [bacterium]